MGGGHEKIGADIVKLITRKLKNLSIISVPEMQWPKRTVRILLKYGKNLNEVTLSDYIPGVENLFQRANITLKS